MASTSRLVSTALVLLAAAARPDGAAAWQVLLARGFGEDVATLVAVDAEANVVAAGRTDVSGDCGRLTVVKLSRRGAVRWATTLPDACARPASLAVDAGGNVHVGGTVAGVDESDFGDPAVVTLDGATGLEVWRVVGADRAARLIRLDPAGDVVAAGAFEVPDPAGGSLVVGVCVKLAGASGDERWRHEAPGAAFDALAVAPTGDVVVGREQALRKLAGSTGVPLWDVPVGMAVGHLGVDAAGDVIAASGSAVAKVAGGDGAPVWSVPLAGFDGVLAGIHDVAVDATGAVVVAGAAAGADFTDFAAVQLAATDGAERWRQVLVAPGVGRARAVAVDGAGDVALAGELAGHPDHPRLGLVKLRGATGAVAWRRTARTRAGDVGAAHDVTFDGRGDVAAAGMLQASDARFAVVRVAGRTGRGARGARVVP
jgi:outer membrane protein assembly factor BamB